MECGDELKMPALGTSRWLNQILLRVRFNQQVQKKIGLGHGVTTSRRTHAVEVTLSAQSDDPCISSDSLYGFQVSQRLTTHRALTDHWLMAVCSAAVPEGFPGNRDELPGITVGVESQLQNAMCGGVSYLAGGVDGTKAIQGGAAGTDNDLAQTFCDRSSGGIHLFKTFIIMFMPIDHQLCPRIVQRFPERLVF